MITFIIHNSQFIIIRTEFSSVRYNYDYFYNSELYERSSHHSLSFPISVITIMNSEF